MNGMGDTGLLELQASYRHAEDLQRASQRALLAQARSSEVDRRPTRRPSARLSLVTLAVVIGLFAAASGGLSAAHAAQAIEGGGASIQHALDPGTGMGGALAAVADPGTGADGVKAIAVGQGAGAGSMDAVPDALPDAAPATLLTGADDGEVAGASDQVLETP